MDAYLSRESYQTLEALSLLAPRSNPTGLLIGHKRGHRYIVERILPTPSGMLISPQKYFDLDRVLDGKIIGFFSAQANDHKTKRILSPFAYGKLFLEVKRSSKSQIKVKPFVVDYAKEFFLTPIRLKK